MEIGEGRTERSEKRKEQLVAGRWWGPVTGSLVWYGSYLPRKSIALRFAGIF